MDRAGGSPSPQVAATNEQVLLLREIDRVERGEVQDLRLEALLARALADAVARLSELPDSLANRMVSGVAARAGAAVSGCANLRRPRPGSPPAMRAGPRWRGPGYVIELGARGAIEWRRIRKKCHVCLTVRLKLSLRSDDVRRDRQCAMNVTASLADGPPGSDQPSKARQADATETAITRMATSAPVRLQPCSAHSVSWAAAAWAAGRGSVCSVTQLSPIRLNGER